MDVVRAAVAEVEDYARVEVRRLPPVHVSGSSVADLTHLIAELVENATAFSAPHTRVHVHGESLGADFALQIHDEGLGMSQDLLAEANRRIGSARQADLFDSDRLGLFVVSRLARRLGLEVQLTPSPFGGTTALVLVPESVLEPPAGAQPDPAHTLPWSAAPTVPATPLPDPVLVGAPTGARPGPSPTHGAPVNGAASRPTAESASGGAAHEGHPDDGEPRDGAPRPEQTGQHPGDAPRPADPAPPHDQVRSTPARRLPRRVRQTHLAPQLREENRSDPRTGGGRSGDDAYRDGADPAPPPSPEQARRTMAEFQRGWREGRTEPNRPPGDAPDPPSATPSRAQPNPERPNPEGEHR
jgi:Histidine kinase-, DNA gyrase B-, and HSP90-like ATPase